MTWKRKVLKIVVWVLVLVGISSIWEFSDVAMYGESQRSAVDAIGAICMTDLIIGWAMGGCDND